VISGRQTGWPNHRASKESSPMSMLPTYSLRLAVLGLLGLSSNSVNDDILTTMMNQDLIFALSLRLSIRIISICYSCHRGAVVRVRVVAKRVVWIARLIHTTNRSQSMERCEGTFSHSCVPQPLITSHTKQYHREERETVTMGSMLTS
jgi:hypothetical protein